MRIVRSKKPTILYEEVDFICGEWRLTLVKEHQWSDWTIMVAAYAPPAIGSKWIGKSFKTLEEAEEWLFVELL